MYKDHLTTNRKRLEVPDLKIRTIMGKDKVKRASGADDERFDGLGVEFKCKLIGFTEVSANRGDNICQEAITKLKQLAIKMNKEKKAHKQRITLNITLKGIRIMDDVTERVDHAHPIHRISYISHDKEDKRTFGYIVGSKDGYKLFAIRTPKEAELITKAFKDLFQVVYNRHQARKDQENSPPQQEQLDLSKAENNSKPAVTGLIALEQDKEQSNLDAFGMDDFGEINEKIEAMQKDGMKRSDSTDLFKCAEVRADSNSYFATFDESPNLNLNLLDVSETTSAHVPKSKSLDFLLEPPKSEHSSSSAGDLLGLNMAGQPADVHLLMQDPFAELKRNILEIQKQQQFQQQRTYVSPQIDASGGRVHPSLNSRSLNPFSSGAAGNMPERELGAYQSRNPFSPMPLTSDDDLGWTVTKRPVPAPRVDVRKAAPQTGADPFAFLDAQLLSQGSTPGDSLYAEVRKIGGDAFGQQQRTALSPATPFDFLG